MGEYLDSGREIVACNNRSWEVRVRKSSIFFLSRINESISFICTGAPISLCTSLLVDAYRLPFNTNDFRIIIMTTRRGEFGSRNNDSPKIRTPDSGRIVREFRRKFSRKQSARGGKVQERLENYLDSFLKFAWKPAN